jgi:hypothetical protein
MVLTGRWRVENLSAHGGDNPAPPVVFGDTVVPQSVAVVIEGTKGAPSARIEFEIRDRKPRCTSIHVDAAVSGRGLRTGDLSTLPSLNALADDAFAELASVVPSGDGDSWIGWDVQKRRAARRDVKARGDDELREVAQAYRDNLDDRPLEAVEALPYRYSRRTAARRVKQARDAGFLPQTTQGKVTG